MKILSHHKPSVYHLSPENEYPYVHMPVHTLYPVCSDNADVDHSPVPQEVPLSVPLDFLLSVLPDIAPVADNL